MSALLEHTGTGAVPERGRRPGGRIAALIAGAVVVAASCAGAVVATADAAPAASGADLAVSQRISAGATSGSTVDVVTVHNAGTSTAGSVQAVYLLKSTTHGYTVRSSTTNPCAIVPAPPGYKAMVTCPLGSVAGGHSVVDTLTWTGSVGVAFSVTASVGAGTGAADPNFANNIGTISSWFGPRADLRLTGTLAAGTKSGTAEAVTTVHNYGPNNASALQQIIEVKGTGITAIRATASTPSASCQFIPAASGYNHAVSCVTNSLETNASWVLKLTYTGPKKGAITVKSSVTANSPADPVTSNNTQTRSTHLHS